MEKILIATDLSANANNAAKYGYALAAALKTKLILCNAFIVPASLTEAGVVVWPEYDQDDLQHDSESSLNGLAINLRKLDSNGSYSPEIELIEAAGKVTDVMNNIVSNQHIDLVICGTHGQKGIEGAIMGNNASHLIDYASYPLLLVPGLASYLPIRKMAFATDFKNPKKDLQAIFNLIPLLKLLHAELLITHVYSENEPPFDSKSQIEGFLLELSNKANYPFIYYRLVKAEKPEEGLSWLCDFGNVDILVMVHREKSYLGRLFGGSHTKKMADRITIPLLVLPDIQ